jgi:hypothetical protein
MGTSPDQSPARLDSEGSASKGRALEMSDTALAIFREMGDRRSAEEVDAQLGR